MSTIAILVRNTCCQNNKSYFAVSMLNDWFEHLALYNWTEDFLLHAVLHSIASFPGILCLIACNKSSLPYILTNMSAGDELQLHAKIMIGHFPLAWDVLNSGRSWCTWSHRLLYLIGPLIHVGRLYKCEKSKHTILMCCKQCISLLQETNKQTNKKNTTKHALQL